MPLQSSNSHDSNFHVSNSHDSNDQPSHSQANSEVTLVVIPHGGGDVHRPPGRPMRRRRRPLAGW
jgi:hypothetical protein